MKLTDFLSIKKGSASPQKVYADMKANLVFNTPEAFILMCAIVIASIGLNVGSTAVVIGAMLISPLMGPIQTIGFSFASGNKDMLKKAIKLFVIQVLIAIGSSTIYFLISPLNQATAEIISRTSPTFWDVLIAIFGGLAGIIGVTRAEKSNVIPGVAIATALMPPLATVGFGIAHFNFQYAIGAFYLFAINAIFIIIASTVGVILIGMRKFDIDSFTTDKRNRRQLQIALLVIIIPSLISSFTLIESQVVNSNVSALVTNQIESDSRKVVSTEIDYDSKQVTLIVVGTYITDRELNSIKETLTEYNLEGYDVKIIQNSVKDTITSTIEAVGNKDE